MYDFLKNSINQKNLRIIYFVAFIYFLNRFLLLQSKWLLNDLLVMPFALSASILKVKISFWQIYYFVFNMFFFLKLLAFFIN